MGLVHASWPQMNDGLDSRRVAARAFADVMKRHRTLESALEAAPGFRQMEARDRAFAWAITATSLRRAGQTEAVLANFLSKPLAETSNMAQALLITAATQLLWMGVPAHAVVSSTVDLAVESTETQRLKGLINAVLRKTATEGAGFAIKTAPQSNLPDWMRATWRKAYGPGRLSRIADAHLNSPPLDITVKDSKEREKWASKLDARILPNGTLRRDEVGDITILPGFAEGAWWAQDAAASIPATLIKARKDDHVVDLCAAPGGKTLQLASTGARVTAIDISEQRLERVQQNLDRTGLVAKIRATDARGWTPKKPVDAVLLDAPCTATGTLRRHPEAAWIKQRSDMKGLIELQRALIKSAIKMLKPGGKLVICTCSLQPEEGEDIARKIRQHMSELDVSPISHGEVPGLAEAITPEGHLRLTPALWKEHGSMDGFFIARFIKQN